MFNIYPVGISQSNAEDTVLIPVDGTLSAAIEGDAVTATITEDEITATITCEVE